MVRHPHLSFLKKGGHHSISEIKTTYSITGQRATGRYEVFRFFPSFGLTFLQCKCICFVTEAHSETIPLPIHWRIHKSISVCLVAQSCPTLRDPMDCNLPGSSVHVIVQAKMLKWAAISFLGYNM